MKSNPILVLAVCFFILSGSGHAQWNTDISQNKQISFSSTESAVPYSVTHPGGTTYISWFSPGSGGFYYPWIQQVDALGYVQWSTPGIQVSSHPSMTWITDYDLAVAPDTSAIIAFQDMRNGANDIFVYKISPEGEFLWGPDGIELSDEPQFEANPVLAVHADNSVTVAWPRLVDAGDSRIILQRLNAAGEKQWSPDVELGEAGFDYTWPRILPVEDGNTLLVWYKEWGPYWAPNRMILAQKFSPAGNPLWGSDAVLFTGIIPVYVHPAVAPDGNGGVYVAWMYEKVSNRLSSFVQHVDADGDVTMAANGVEVSSNGNLHLEPAIGSDTTTGNAYVFWRESDLNQTQFGLSGQVFDAAGNQGWGTSGLTIHGLSSRNAMLINVTGVPGGAVTSYLYDEPGSSTEQRVKAVRLDEAGTQVWGGVLDVSTYPDGKGYLSAGELTNSQFVFCWNDDRLGHPEIFAQNLSIEGLPGPMEWPVEVFPDTLWFLTPESFEGQNFYIHNPNTFTLDVQHVDQFGAPVGNFAPWYIMPYILSFPVYIAPGDTLEETVLWAAIDPETMSGPIAYDTLNVITLTDTARVIIAVDTMFIWIGQQEHRTDELKISIFPNPADDQFRVKYVSPSCNTGEILLMDLTGRVLDRENLYSADGWNEKRFETQWLENGSYLIRVISGEKKCHRIIQVVH